MGHTLLSLVLELGIGNQQGISRNDSVSMQQVCLSVVSSSEANVPLETS